MNGSEFVFRLLAAKHQVHFDRFVYESGIGDLAVELLFKPVEQAWTEHPFQSGVIGCLRSGLEPLALTEPVPFRGWNGVSARTVASRHVAQPMQQWEYLVEIAIGDQRLFMNASPAVEYSLSACSVCSIRFEFSLKLVSQPANNATDTRPIKDSATVFRMNSAPHRAPIGRNPVRLADDHLGNQIGEEVALARPE